MSIRRTIILLTVPLFLGLALINGALLYFQEKAEMAQALGDFQSLERTGRRALFVRFPQRDVEQFRQFANRLAGTKN